mgnify:CR=1 FL=1
MNSPDDLDNDLAELLARRTSAVDASRLSAHQAAVDGRSRALKRQRRRWSVAALPLVLVVIGALVVGRGPDKDRSAVGSSVPDGTTTLVPPAATDETGGASDAEDYRYISGDGLGLTEEEEAADLQEIREIAPRPELPAPQAQAWAESYERMRSCFQEHGFDGAEAVASTFGDGNTPMPIINAAAPGYAEASPHCRMDFVGVDRDALNAALESAAARAVVDNESTHQAQDGS